MRYFKKLPGKRVFLSPLNKDDVEKYVEWLNDIEVAVHLNALGMTLSVEKEKEWLEGAVKRDNGFAIVDAGKDELIGNCGLHNLDQVNRSAEVGIFIGNKEYWNKGYGEEALRLLLDYGFNVLNLNNIMLKVFGFNKRAHECYRKTGFREIGRRRNAKVLGGRTYDIIYMDIIADEYQGSLITGLLEGGDGS